MLHIFVYILESSVTLILCRRNETVCELRVATYLRRSMSVASQSFEHSLVYEVFGRAVSLETAGNEVIQ